MYPRAEAAWFMAHRIREAMRDGGALLDGDGGIVEADRTYSATCGSPNANDGKRPRGCCWPGLTYREADKA